MKKPIALFFALSTSLALGSMVPACGGDDDTTGSGGSGGSTGGRGGSGGSTGGSGGTGGTTGGSGGGGTGGTAGKGGTAGTPGDAGPDGFAPVVCGTKTCEADTSGPIPLAACCAPGETNTCGFDVLGTCLTTTPGTPDPLCRDQPSPIPGLPGITGCCRPNGLCGGTTGAPIGCNDFSMLGLPAVPCGPDAAPPPPPDSGPADVTPPPPDSGPADTSNDRATDTGTSDISTGDGSTDAPAEGGGSDGAIDANNDSAG